MPTSTKPLFAVSVLLAVVAGLFATSFAQAPVLPAVAGSGVVLLRNGQILSGQIARSGDRYEVSVDGGRISVKASDVDLCCPSLEEVYQQKRARLTLPEARDYLDLARWCQQQGLLEHAREELLRAEAAEPTHPLIPLLRRSVELAERPPAAEASAAMVRTASFNMDELDRLIREMPPGAVESFAQTIQPLLVNRCAAAACHGPGAVTRFSLIRPSPGRPPSRRLTQRNLSAVLEWVDRHDAAASRVLTAPIRPHGNLEKAVFLDHDAPQYTQLVHWVWRVVDAGRPSDAQSAPARLQPVKPPPESLPAIPFALPAKEANSPPLERSWAEELQGLDLDLVSPASQGEALPDANLPAPGLIAPQPPARRGAALPQFTPRDPFDPEIFNRRFFGPG